MQRRRYVVAYDIRDPKRLRAVHLVCREWGDPLQYSVFVCDLGAGERVTFLGELRQVLRETEDSVVLIDLGEAHARGAECFQFIGHIAYALPDGGPTIL